MQQENVAAEIAYYRKNGQMDKAIEVTRSAIKHYPDSHVFYEILGELSLQEGDYETAGQAYVNFLTKINGNIQYFKKFVRFWGIYIEAANSEQKKTLYDEIVRRFDANEFPKDLKGNIALVIFDMHPDKNNVFANILASKKELTPWINKEEKAGTQWNIYCFLYWSRYNYSPSASTAQKDKQLVAIMEKYELYRPALDIIEKMLEYTRDEVVVRTLFRLCRKLGDYSRADYYILMNPEVEQRDGFNIQYEFVYYYLKKNDEVKLLNTLKKIRNSARSSIPISRTLQNFYVKLGMIDEAMKMRKHISQLEEEKYSYSKAAETVKGAPEERETEEAFWDAIKDMVSEQEHNRQLIAIKELLKGFSHELGQPITNIRYGVQLYQMKMERGVESKENLEVLLSDILNQTIRVKRLLKRFAPIVSSKSVNTKFNCIEHIRTVIQDMQMRLESIGIKTQIEGIREFVLYGDCIQFEQVIYNLVSNSVDELRDKEGEKKIQVLCQEKEELLIIHFRDNGNGVSKEDVNKIFTPFYSKKNKEKSDGGEGLGLYIVWNILKMYGGKIRVNLSYREGAEFLIQIPKAGENKNV